MPIFGGYSEMQDAPHDTYVRHLLRWEARREAEALQQNQGSVSQEIALWKASQQ